MLHSWDSNPRILVSAVVAAFVLVAAGVLVGASGPRSAAQSFLATLPLPISQGGESSPLDRVERGEAIFALRAPAAVDVALRYFTRIERGPLSEADPAAATPPLPSGAVLVLAPEGAPTKPLEEEAMTVPSGSSAPAGAVDDDTSGADLAAGVGSDLTVAGTDVDTSVGSSSAVASVSLGDATGVLSTSTFIVGPSNGDGAATPASFGVEAGAGGAAASAGLYLGGEDTTAGAEVSAEIPGVASVGFEAGPSSDGAVAGAAPLRGTPSELLPPPLEDEGLGGTVSGVEASVPAGGLLGP